MEATKSINVPSLTENVGFIKNMWKMGNGELIMSDRKNKMAWIQSRIGRAERNQPASSVNFNMNNLNMSM